jgi:hypothetical protein
MRLSSSDVPGRIPRFDQRPRRAQRNYRRACIGHKDCVAKARRASQCASGLGQKAKRCPGPRGGRRRRDRWAGSGKTPIRGKPHWTRPVASLPPINW